ncbi:MAG: alpha/beta fold hydrolase [Bellilinea sp.]
MTRPIFENPQLDGSTFSLNGSSDTGVLLSHGFTSTTVEVRPLAEFLHRAGYSVMAPLLPGHGTRPEDALKVHKADWLRTADQAYQSLKTRTRRVVVGGESMGALLALHLASMYPEIAGVVTFAPAIHVSGQWRAVLLAPFVKIQPKYYLQDENSSPPADILPWQGYNVLPIPAVAQFFWLQQQVRRELKSVRQPALIFQGKLDGTIDPDGAKVVLNQLGSPDKKLVWLENSGHTLLLGREYNQIYQDTLAFIQRVTQ